MMEFQYYKIQKIENLVWHLSNAPNAGKKKICSIIVLVVCGLYLIIGIAATGNNTPDKEYKAQHNL